MSFVGAPYTHDIFISYNHGDVPGEGAAYFLSWSRAFFTALRKDLLAHEGLDDIGIFFDQSPVSGTGVDPFVSLRPELEGQVRRSAMLMPLISPRYLKSAWCTDERLWWFDQQKADRLETRGRLAPIWIWGQPPRDFASWREAVAGTPFDDLVGVYFYDRQPSNTEYKPYGWPGEAERIVDQNFHRSIDLISSRVIDHLTAFRRRLAERAGQAATGAGKPSIYLHGRGDAAKPWSRTFEALEHAGFAVKPATPERIERDNAKRNAVRDERVKAMSGCDALFIVAPDDDAALDKELLVVGQHERGLAIDYAANRLGRPGKRLPFAVVDPVRDARKAARRKDDLSGIGVEWFKLTAPHWVEDAAQWLKRAA